MVVRGVDHFLMFMTSGVDILCGRPPEAVQP